MKMEAPHALTCTECGGAIREVNGSGVPSYRCHTGHRFSADELLVHQLNDVERAVTVAIRVLHERVVLCQRMMEDAGQAGRKYGVPYWIQLKDEADNQSRVLQQFLASREPATSHAE